MTLELIETLWNVNYRFRHLWQHHPYELIETLWNVNEDVDLFHYTIAAGINRNIVECKCLLTTYRKLLQSELIETLWNVNSVRERYQ